VLAQTYQVILRIRENSLDFPDRMIPGRRFIPVVFTGQMRENKIQMRNIGE